MASVHTIRSHYSPWLALLFLLPALHSCNAYNFSNPQPVDRENIYEFPDEFLGAWYEVDTFSSTFSDTIPLKGPAANNSRPGLQYSAGSRLSYSEGLSKTADMDSSHLRISKKYVQLIFLSRERVAMGAWPKVGKQGELVYPGSCRFSDELQREIKYDSLQRPVDTINNYLVSGDRIYRSQHNEYLDKGYAFYYDHDSIIILKNDTVNIDLGQNAFLRKLDDKRYVFNFLNRLIGDDGSRFDQWWSLRILEINGPGTFQMWDCSGKTGDLPSMFHAAVSKANIFYFNSQWTTAEVLALLQQGYFETGGSYYQKK